MSEYPGIVRYWERQCLGGIPATPFLMQMQEKIFEEIVGFHRVDEWNALVSVKALSMNSDFDVDRVIAGAWIRHSRNLIDSIRSRLIELGVQAELELAQLEYRWKNQLPCDP